MPFLETFGFASLTITEVVFDFPLVGAIVPNKYQVFLSLASILESTSSTDTGSLVSR